MNRVADVLARMRELPIADPGRLTGGGTIMVLAPHPDDETLGCGGLIAEACARSQPPIVVVVSDGAASHPGSASFPPTRLRAIRAREVSDALDMLGLPDGRLHLLGLPDTKLPFSGPDFDRAVAQITAIVRVQDCKTICATWRHDPHGDHEATSVIARAVATATGAALLSYPVWGWLLPENAMIDEELPQGWRLDIRHHAARKRRAIAAHSSQYGTLITDDPHGFAIPAALLAVFDAPFETFIVTP